MKPKIYFYNTATFFYSVWFLYWQLIIHCISTNDFSRRPRSVYGSHYPAFGGMHSGNHLAYHVKFHFDASAPCQYAKLSTLSSSSVTYTAQRHFWAALTQHASEVELIYVFSCFRVILISPWNFRGTSGDETAALQRRNKSFDCPQSCKWLGVCRWLGVCVGD